MKELWNRSLAIICVITLLLSLQGVQVFANELNAETPYEVVDSVNEDEISEAPLIDDNDFDSTSEIPYEETSEVLDFDNQVLENPSCENETEESLVGSAASQAISLDDAKYYVSQIRSAEVRNGFYSLFDEFPPYQGGGTKIYNDTSGSYWTNKINENISSGTKTGGAWQCFGFALYCYAKLFHCLGTDANTSDSAMLLQGATSASYSSFANAGVKPGAHIRAVSSGNTGHSMVVLYYDSDCIVVYHANGDGKGTVYAGRYTWSQFNSAQLGGHSPARHIRYVAMPYGYPSDEQESLDLGSSFYAYIINTAGWTHVTPNLNGGNVYVSKGDADEKVFRFERQDDGSYKITTIDGRCIEVHNFESANGTAVELNNYNGNTAQRWYIYGESGAYELVAACGSNCMDMDGGSSEDGTRIQMWERNGSNAQKFQIWKVPEAVSGTVGVGAGTKYTPTQIWWEAGENATKYDVKLWKGRVWEGDAYKSIWNLTDTSCSVDLPSGYYEGYVDYRNGYSLSMSRNTISFTVGEGQPVDIGDGFYAVILVNEHWKPLTVSGSNVQLGDGASEGKTEYWKFERQNDGSYVIRSAADDRVLETEGIRDENQTNVEVYPYNGGDNQKWYIYGRWSGEYYLRPKSATRVLDVYGGANNAGDNLNLWDLNYSTAQKFAIYKHDAPGAAKLTCTPGTSVTPTEFRWNETTETKTYSLRIYKGEHWVGENVANVWDTTDTSCSVQLPAGDYEAYIDSANVFAYTMSNVVKFSVGKASVANATVTGITDRTYTGSAQTQTPTVKIGNKVLSSGTDYSLSYSNNTNVGTATVTITGKGNCTGSVSKTFKINAASITGATVTGISNRTYSGTAQTQNPTVKVGDRTLTNGTDYTLSYANNTNVGTATVTITGKGNYSGSVSKTFTIGGQSIANATVTGISNRTYSGTAQTQSPTVKVGDRTLTNGTDYTLSHSNNTNAGTATVTITGKGNYSGSLSKTFTISALSISDATVTGISNKTYTGSAQTQNPTVKLGEKTLVSGTDYTVSYANNTNAGTATVKVTGKGNYAGTVSKTFTISAASITGATVTGITNKPYTGTAQTQSPTVKLGEKTLAPGTDYTLSYANNTNAGTATVTISGKGNYAGTISKTFTISAASITGATVTGIAGRTYTGAAQTQSPTVKLGEKTLASGTDYTLSYANNTNAGTATVTISGKGNYAGTISKTFTISAASITGATVTGIAGRTYTGAAQTQSPTVKLGEKTLASGTDYTLSYANNTNAGTATVTISGKGNYAGTISKTFTISATSITGATVTGIANRTYTGTAQTQSPTVKLGEKTLVSGTDYTLSYANNTNAGTATVKVIGKGNYTGTISKTFTINKAAAKLTFASTSIFKTTQDAAFINSLTKTTDGSVTFKSSNAAVAAVDPASGQVTIKGIGTATITVTAAEGTNYKAGSAGYTVTVVDGRTDISGCTVTLSPASYTYNGKERKPAVTVTSGTTPLTFGTDYTVTYTNNKTAGTATATVTGKGSYTGTNSKTFKISKAASKLTFAESSVSKKTTDGAFTNTLKKTTDGSVTFKSSNTAVAAVDPASGQVTIKGIGTATITVTAAEGTNYKAGSAGYTVTVVDGRTDISGCTVTLSPASYTYNGKERKPAVTVTSGTTTLTSGTDYTVTYTNNKTAGTATATVTGKGSYTGTNSATFTINKAAAKLTFENANVSKTTKDAAFTNALTKTTDGTVTFKSSNTGVATVSSTSGLVTVKGAGEAVITATASAGTNYKAGSASYTLTVTAPAPTGFSDVQDPSHPFYNAIYWAADAGITKGYPDGTFGIDRSCTRGEAVMFLWRMAGKPAPVEALTSPFSDVPQSHAFYKAILWASQRGITKGYSDGTFGISRTCTRGHIMTFIWRFKGQPTPKAVTKSPFSDVPMNHAYYKAILWGSQSGVTKGFSDGTFGINKDCTRGQIVTFLYRIK